MTVSQGEAEVGLLRAISEGDGEIVVLTDLRARDLEILNDLLASGLVAGNTYKGGMARLRITIAGETYLEDRERFLLSGEAEGSVRPSRRGNAVEMIVGLTKYSLEHFGNPLIVGVVLLAVAFYFFQ